jgi:hypothetical protein
MTLPRIQKLESLGFEWDVCVRATWEERLSDLADYRKIHGHCNVPRAYSENSKLVHWVSKQRKKYKLQQQGKKSQMTPARIRELESLGFQWDCSGARGSFPGATWEDRLSELVEYREIHGNCNVPKRYSENAKLAHWVGTQRYQYKLQQEGKGSQMTLPRVKVLEGLGFKWKVSKRAGR